MLLIKKYGYDKAEKYVITELKNCVAYYVRMRQEYGVSNDSVWLEEEFKDPIYEVFDKTLKRKTNFTELDKAIYTRNAESTWNLILADNRKFNLRKMTKRMLRRFI